MVVVVVVFEEAYFANFWMRFPLCYSVAMLKANIKALCVATVHVLELPACTMMLYSMSTFNNVFEVKCVARCMLMSHAASMCVTGVQECTV